jgi:hypothetical protein
VTVGQITPALKEGGRMVPGVRGDAMVGGTASAARLAVPRIKLRGSA